MASYIYMKVLESQPGRYDRGISWLSFGRADRVKQRIAEEIVRPGMKVLEIGAGTGSFAIMAAKKGAEVKGFDLSPAMLSVAREKVDKAGLNDKVELEEMGVAGMDGIEAAAFDLVVSTLVFSELSAQEQDYALIHALRSLQPGGRLALADESKPESTLKAALHQAVRIPLMIITFALTQTSTKAVQDLPERVARAGFVIEAVERKNLGSFIYLVARKEE